MIYEERKKWNLQKARYDILSRLVKIVTTSRCVIEFERGILGGNSDTYTVNDVFTHVDFSTVYLRFHRSQLGAVSFILCFNMAIRLSSVGVTSSQRKKQDCLNSRLIQAINSKKMITDKTGKD